MVPAFFGLLLVLFWSGPSPSHADIDRWSPIGPEGETINVIALDPQNPDILYAATTANGVFKTTDAGESWIAVNEGLKTGTTIPALTSLAIDPEQTNVLYAGTSSEGIFKSTNGAGLWNAINSELNFIDIREIVINPLNPNTLYVGLLVPCYRPESGLFKSTDGGETWSPANTGLPTYLDIAE